MRRKIGRQPIKLSMKKTTVEEDVELNVELIKICLEAVEKYVLAIEKRKSHLSTLEDREAKVCQYCNFRAFCRIQEVSQSPTTCVVLYAATIFYTTLH